MEEKALLEVRHLNVFYRDRKGWRRTGGRRQILRDVNFTLNEGEILGLVGESGCGKTTLSRAILGINRDVEGEILRPGGNPRMVFQDPASSLNPAWTVGKILEEPLRNAGVEKNERRRQAEEMLRLVGLDPSHYDRYPRQLSGGQRQRVGIGAAIIGSPKLVIADEPVSALDVTIQAQILDLLRHLKDKINSSIMLITHDLGVIAEMADYVVVMYAGRVVEKGTAQEIFENPCHPYTIGLMASKPVVGKQVDELYSIPGKVPNPINMPNYCYFKDRCEMCVEGCEGAYPHEISISPTHKVSCYRYYENNNGKAGE